MCEDFTNGFDSLPAWIYEGVSTWPNNMGHAAAGHWSATGGRTSAGCIVSDINPANTSEHAVNLLIDLGAECHFKRLSLYDRTTSITGGNSFPHYILFYNSSGQAVGSSPYLQQLWQYTSWNQYVHDMSGVGGLQNVRYIWLIIVTTAAGGPLYIDDLEVQFM